MYFEIASLHPATLLMFLFCNFLVYLGEPGHRQMCAYMCLHGSNVGALRLRLINYTSCILYRGFGAHTKTIF